MFNTKEKKERSLGTKLFLKGERCASPKCAMVRRGTRPGVHGSDRRRAPSEYGEQLREAQKFRFTYGLRGAQLRRTFERAAKHAGVTGAMFLALLERRLDSVLYRMGIAPSRSVARQLVGHGHVSVNGRRVRAPSYAVRPGDRIAIRESARTHPALREAAARLKQYEPPSWLRVDPEKLEGEVLAAPRDLDVPFDVNRVVDYYSKMVK